MLKVREKAFADYVQGYMLEEICERHSTPMGTVKCWMYRDHWKDRKQGLFYGDGAMDKDMLNRYLKEAGSLPAVNERDPNTMVFENPRDRERATRLNNSLMAAIDFLTIEQVTSTEEAYNRVVSYFESCIEFALHPTFEGVCLCLGITKRQYSAWMNGAKSGTVSPVLLEKIRLCLAEAEGQSARSGDIPYVLYMFISKNHYDMKDQVDTVITHNNSQSVDSVEEIASRLKASLPIEDAEYDEETVVV